MRSITMFSAFTFDSRYNKSVKKFIGNVYCLNKMCSDIICVHKKIFQSLERNDHHGLQRSCTRQLRNNPFEKQTNSFLLEFGCGIYIFRRQKNQFKKLLEMCISNKPKRKVCFPFNQQNFQFPRL